LAGGRAGGERLGILVPSTEIVQPVLHALAERGVRPGRDVSVTGLLTDVLAETLQPPVTNVSLEPRDVSRRAMQALFRLLDRDHPRAAAPVELVTPRLTRRNTTLPD
jgi:DNA-binding LacI/PurR family transcriptional regulator